MAEGEGNGQHLALALEIKRLAQDGCAKGQELERRVKAVEDRQDRTEEKLDSAKNWLIANLVGVIFVLAKLFWPAAVNMVGK